VERELPELVARLLADRGIADAAARDEYFSPSLTNLAKPEDLPGITEAVEAILATPGKVVVFGDYDCDGVCATAILVQALQALGRDVDPFIPNRLTEGYGMTDVSIARFSREHPDARLLITVDNGINSVSQVVELKAKGMTVVITDHHLPGDELPAADAVVDPKVAAPDRLNGLCGAGVAFLLANALIAEATRRGEYAGGRIGGPLLILAGLATVTDIMPLVAQNRILVAEALKHFPTWAPVGLRELHARAAKSGLAALTAKDFGFLLGPRINAAGRMASGMEALELLLTDDREIARECARIVDAHNLDRKNIEQQMTDAALAQVVPGAAAQVIDLPDGHPGVAGIVAARVLERLGSVPVCVIAGGHGSARAPDGINIRDAFESCKDVLDRYGGHAAAGGFSVKDGRVDEFRARLNRYCEPLVGPRSGEAPVPPPDAWVRPAELTLELGNWFALMEPFGEGNPEPVLGLRGVVLADVRQLGSDGRHLSLNFRNREIPRAVWWNHGELVEELRRDSLRPYDVTFSLAISDYGERHLELRLRSIVPSADEGEPLPF